MITISILVPRSSVMQSIVDPRYLFTAINQFRTAAAMPAPFNVQLVAAASETILENGMITVRADRLLADSGQSDLVIIPALFNDMKTAVELNRELVPWIIQQYKGGADIASLCVGAFLLAETGLVDGKRCSTHWGYADQLRQMYPQVEVVDGNIITEESRLFSSGGALSYWNLLLHLAEKYTDRETAILASKYFAVDINRSSQFPFTVFRGQKNHRDEPIRRAQDLIEQHVTERISVDELASKVSLGRRSFERRFKKATQNSVLEYIQRVKVEAAKRSFETTMLNINEVMYEVGYSDTKAFRTIFRKITGLTPPEYRSKYHRMADSAAA